MADNTTLNTGTGGDVIATDDLLTLNGGAVSGFKIQRVKVCFGSDSVARDVDATNGLPIVGCQDSRTSGTITTSASVVGPVSVLNRNLVTVDISGTYAGVTFVFEGTPDGTNYYPIQGVNNANGQAGSTWTPGTNASASYDFAVGAYTSVRVRATAYTSGTGNVGITPQTFAYDPAPAALAQGLAASGTAIVGAPVLMGGTFTTTLPTVTTGQAVNLQTTARGEQLVAISSGATAVAVKAASTAAATTDPSLVVSVAGANSAIKIGDGTNNAVITAASTAAAAASASLTVALSPNSGLAPTTNALHACTTGIAAALTTASIKASAGSVYGISIANLTASTVYLQFYNQATAPTLGTGVVWFIAVPASGTVTIPPGAIALANFTTGIGIGASTTATSTGTPATAPAVTIFYK